MKYLTFLDYLSVEGVGRDFKSKLEEQEKRHQEQLNEMDKKYNEKTRSNNRCHVKEPHTKQSQDRSTKKENKIEIKMCKGYNLS